MMMQSVRRKARKRFLSATCFHRVIDVARGQEARLFERRAATDIAWV